jgi:protein TonB
METFNEILFKNRNKEYGSYTLRMKYNKYVAISVGISMLVLGLFLSYPIVAAYVNKSNFKNDINKEVGVEIRNIPKDVFVPPPPPATSVVMNVPKFTAPVVVDEDVESNMESQDNLATQPNSNLTETEVVVVDKPTEQVIAPPVEVAPIFIVVEEQPFLNGMYEFLSQNIKYPEEAKELGIQGKVFVTFVVEKDGSIADVKVLRGIGGGCDEEAVRVVRSMPKWNPGKQRGEAVRVQFNLPVKFTLN